jgi:hypothetical protein
MKPLLVALAALTSVTAAATALAVAGGVPSRLPPGAPAGQQVLYGHVKSLDRKGGRYVMRFDPAQWLGGYAAEQACHCRPVPNDYFIVDETHRLLSYVVAPDAGVSVVTAGGQVGAAAVSVADLAQIVKGKNPTHHRLMEPKAGFWIRVGDKYPNPVLELDQQYQP